MFIAVSLLTACAIVPAGRHGNSSGGIMIAPLLPSVVVLEVEPFYFYSDFHYHYTNDRWYYSRSRSGPWGELPRDRYPRETRYKGKSWKHDRGRDDDHRDRDRDDDRRDRDHDNRR